MLAHCVFEFDTPALEDMDSSSSTVVEEEEEEEKENGKRLFGESENPPQKKKRLRKGIEFNDIELGKTKIILAAVWPSRTTSIGKWYTQVSVRSLQNEGRRSADLLVMERFNPECGLFRSVLVIPATVWLDKMLEIREKITSLFQSCHTWKDRLVVRKALVF